MVGPTSRRLIHSLNELKRLERHHFAGLAAGEAKTAQTCGPELRDLALHYRTFVSARRLGPEARTCGEIAAHFRAVAEAMAHLHGCLSQPPPGLRTLLDTYQHGHAAWTLDGSRRAGDVDHAVMQLWRDGQAAAWFLPEPPAPGLAGSAPNRQDELATLGALMAQLAEVYQRLETLAPRGRETPGEAKEALVFSLADLIRRKARPVLHTVGIATRIHQWATGDPNPAPDPFQAAYRTWKQRPRSGDPRP